MEERDAPSRAEVDAIGFVTREWEQADRIQELTDFLTQRGCSEQDISGILADLDSYEHWIVEPLISETENAQRSTPAGNEES